MMGMEVNPYEPPKTIEPHKPGWFNLKSESLIEVLTVFAVILVLATLVGIASLATTIFAPSFAS